MATTATHTQTRYGVKELVLIVVALAVVAVTIWYVNHSTVIANNAYSIQETSQKPVVKKPARQ